MTIVLGLGANMQSAWGPPIHTMLRVTHLLGVYRIDVKGQSPIYESEPLGVRAQANFANAVVVADTSLPPQALLRTLKSLERSAGRRSKQRWGPRPLDIDILDYAGLVTHWPAVKPRSLLHLARSQAPRERAAARTSLRPPLVLPHPQLHLRAFALQPLVDIMPRWHHPVTGESAAQLLNALPRDARSAQGRIRRVLTSAT